MRRQTLFFRQLDNIGGDLVQGRFVKLGHTAAAQKTVAGQSGCPSAGAAGRQHVTRAGCVIAQRNRRVMPQEGRAAVANLGDLISWVGRFDVQVLGSELIGQLTRVFLDREPESMRRRPPGYRRSVHFARALQLG